MRAVTLQPAAGAQGELTGILMIRAYHRDRGDTERDEVLVPDSSPRHEPGDGVDGRLQDDHDPVGPRRRRRRRRVPRPRSGPRTAAVMITNPSTLGLFESAHRRAARRGPRGRRAGLHGRRQPQRHPRPVQARRGRLRRDALQRPQDVLARRTAAAGPGAGPVGVGETLLPYLPDAAGPARGRRHVPPRAARASARRSIGRLRSFVGNTGVLVRAYAYIRAHGASGLREVSDDAVLAANYLKHRLAGTFDLPYDRPASTSSWPRRRSIKKRDRRPDARHRQAAHRLRLPPADDLLPADRRGGDADRADRDRVGRDARRVRRRAHRDRRRGRDAIRTWSPRRPTRRPVRRLDEATAARQPNLRWRPMTGAQTPCPD